MVNLDNRVEVLEDNGGDGGNITVLEGRVTVLESRVDMHDTGIAQLNQSIQELGSSGLCTSNYRTYQIQESSLNKQSYLKYSST